ncbi:hypothetical protein T4A_4209 [Trichinella pseudospiralis]|uniref:Uncharacterized protein n=1 Tax=Trichinella pseudospiralis TaxID=6337 RepID=A0A0V1C865_TRIPS|nr:hypothetical protein T4A_4209 [Trichinella pseudospiralis]
MSLQGNCWPRSLAFHLPLSDTQAKADPSDHFEYQFLLPECQCSDE